MIPEEDLHKPLKNVSGNVIVVWRSDLEKPPRAISNDYLIDFFLGAGNVKECIQKLHEKGSKIFRSDKVFNWFKGEITGNFEMVWTGKMEMLGGAANAYAYH